MKEAPLSNCERSFTLGTIEKKQRFDGREAFEYRDLEISFGKDYGFCQVKLGQTMVMAQVTGTIIEPKPSRPNEGVLMVNLELSPMANPSFEPGRASSKGVQMNRILERCLRESNCIDLESLCIIAEQQVWEIRLDITVLNHDGNLLDVCSVAAITSLSHFKRPDVSVHDGQITIHKADEKEFIPLSVLHVPVCTTFTFFHSGKYMLLDSTYREERVMEGQLMVARNKHREICALHMSGTHLLNKEQVTRCVQISQNKVLMLTTLIQTALNKDKELRDGENYDYRKSAVNLSDIYQHEQQDKYEPDIEQTHTDSVNMKEINRLVAEADLGNDNEEMDESEEKTEAHSEIGEGGASTWLADLPQTQHESANLTESQTKSKTSKKKKRKRKNVMKEMESGSEEDETLTLTSVG